MWIASIQTESHDGQAVCHLFERSARSTKASARKKDLQSFFGAYRDDDFFPLMRLLLPQVRDHLFGSAESGPSERRLRAPISHPPLPLVQLDKERQTYGMKESVLAKLYVHILGISPDSDDGRRLIHWRRPARGAQSGEAGDFGTAVYESLKKR